MENAADVILTGYVLGLSQVVKSGVGLPHINDPDSELLWSSWLLLLWAVWFVVTGASLLFSRARSFLTESHTISAPVRQDQRAVNLRCVAAFLGAADWCACAAVCREWNAVLDATQSQEVYAKLQERCNGQAQRVRRLVRIPPECRRTAFRFMRERVGRHYAQLPPLAAFSRDGLPPPANGRNGGRAKCSMAVVE
jgi:hypothetical protein